MCFAQAYCHLTCIADIFDLEDLQNAIVAKGGYTAIPGFGELPEEKKEELVQIFEAMGHTCASPELIAEVTATCGLSDREELLFEDPAYQLLINIHVCLDIF